MDWNNTEKIKVMIWAQLWAAQIAQVVGKVQLAVEVLTWIPWAVKILMGMEARGPKGWSEAKIPLIVYSIHGWIWNPAPWAARHHFMATTASLILISHDN